MASDGPSGTTSSSLPLRTSTIDADGNADGSVDSDASPCAPTATPVVLTSASSSQKPHEAAQVTRMKAGLDSHSPTVLMK